MRSGMLKHAIMKFHMRQPDRYECGIPHPVSLDGKYQMFCSRENKQSGVYNIGVHYDLQNSSMFPRSQLEYLRHLCFSAFQNPV